MTDDLSSPAVAQGGVVLPSGPSFNQMDAEEIPFVPPVVGGISGGGAGVLVPQSEFSHGPGMFPNRQRNVSPGAGGGHIVPQPQALRNQYEQMVAEKRTDSTDPNSSAELMLTYQQVPSKIPGQSNLGNPDRYGAGPALVRESNQLPIPTIDVHAPGGVIGAVKPVGVEREP